MSRVLKYAASFSSVESFFGEEMQRLAIFFEDQGNRIKFSRVFSDSHYPKQLYTVSS
jgi:hypothetical protein